MVASAYKIDLHFRPAIRRDLARRSGNVVKQSRYLLQGYGAYPRRVRTGELLSSVSYTFVGFYKTRIGSNVRWALWVHDGTGIYGPKKQKIRPTRAQALAFHYHGKLVIVKSVKGMKPNHYLKDALRAAKD